MRMGLNCHIQLHQGHYAVILENFYPHPTTITKNRVVISKARSDQQLQNILHTKYYELLCDIKLGTFAHPSQQALLPLSP